MKSASIVAAAATAFALPATAQGISCGVRSEIVETLIQTYGENFSGGGLQDDSAVYEVWTSEAAGTWTILLTRPDGTSCVMAAGTNWLPQLERHIVSGRPS